MDDADDWRWCAAAAEACIWRHEAADGAGRRVGALGMDRWKGWP